MPEPSCAVCGRPAEDGLDCRLCAQAALAGGWGFDGARAGGVYYGPLRHGVHRLKYQGAEPLGPALGAFLANRCVVDGLLPAGWRAEVAIVVPLPLHPARERRRGYNQATLLAAPLAEMLGVPLEMRAVRRARKAPPQVGLSGAQRRRNVSAEMFAVPDPARVAGRGVLLVDDVFTTGATVSACAAALRQAGGGPVYAVTLAAGG